ncbi:sporulation protein YqfC [Kineothrix alysoides]|jgi:sporulation protein YqfC|uniref:Sporulation protein YqfC n=1 Tax=Kineothrix alysoides TaxID=1469948 RepID=A0A4R1R3A4_9FIRM|nr:YabP/YqfC family sporulation protein [Kineothrix alysoides]TCL59885.1 sporulation protein YqfC [Kineothrix alysoides]
MMRNHKQSGKQKLERKKEVIVESLKLPKDSVLGASIVTITGNTDAFVENYRGILEYSEELILLQGKTCQISIIGKRMSIDYYTNEDMKISGYIECIRYHNSY